MQSKIEKKLMNKEHYVPEDYVSAMKKKPS